jgi:hypothetical protein
MQAEFCDGSDLWRRVPCALCVAFALGGCSLNERRGGIFSSKKRNPPHEPANFASLIYRPCHYGRPLPVPAGTTKQ